MEKSMWERCQLIKLTSAQFAEGLNNGWFNKEYGAALVEVLPALATVLLATMTKNRPKKPLNKAKVTGALLGGYWVPNGEPIILSALLKLIDGQHRLESCIETGLPLLTVITWGWPEDCFDTIDTGAKRSGGDLFSADGETNATMLSAAVRYDWRIVHKDLLSGNQIPEARMRAYLKENPHLHASLSWGSKVQHLIPKGLGAALHYRFSQQDAALAKQFFDDIAKGENINGKEHTSWHLRDLLLVRQKAQLRLSNEVQAQIAANVIKGWKATRAGKILNRQQLMWYGLPPREEPFPDLQ